MPFNGLAKPKILLVDDRPENLVTLGKSLQKIEAEYVSVTSGNEALKEMLKQNFALAILDVQMPGMSGYELANIIRSSDEYKNLPIIFLTAVYSDDLHISKGYESGGVDFITKPYDPKLLRAKVKIFLALYRDRQEIQQSKEFFQKTYDALADTVLIQDEEMRIVSINRVGCHLLGLSEDEILGRHCYEVFHDSSSPCPECCLANINEQLLKSHSWDVNHDCLGLSFQVTASSLQHGSGKNFLTLYVAKDITNQLKLQERLLQAEKLEAIGILAGGIAHDFNNILAVILGNAELSLFDDNLDPKLTQRLQQIQDAGNRAKELVAQILTYSRKTQHSQSPIILEPIIKEAVKLLRSTIPHSVKIEQKIELNIDKVMADPIKVHQIVMNLCTNSFHALPKEHGLISISLQKMSTTDDGELADLILPCLRLRVADNGGGMDQACLAKIFDPFFTTKAAGQGTGIGLAVVKEIVDEFGGKILVTSEPGHGTVFNIYLPIIETQPGDQEKVSIAPLLWGSGQILVVDDEQLIRIMTQNILEYLGYDALCVGSAQQALATFGQDPTSFAAVISDQGMPNMTGAELIPELIALRNDIPIIITTGHSAQISEDKAKELGAKGFLLKPIAIKTMADTLHKILPNDV